MPEAREVAAIRHPAEAQFRLLVDAMTDEAVVLLDPDGRASTWNTGAERVTGRGAEQVIGRSVSWFYPDEDVQAGRPLRDLQDAEARGRIEGEGWRCRGDGTRFWASVVITALRDRDASLIGFALVARDQTERTRAEDAHAEKIREHAAQVAAESGERRYRFLAKAIPQIVWTARPDGVLDSFNPRWGEYTGLRTEEVRGLGWLEALHSDDVNRFLDAWSKARSNAETFEIDLRLRRADGTFRWHLARAVPVRLRAGGVVKWLGTCTDIDDQKRAEGRLGFLAEVGAVLASSLDYEATLSSLARLAVPNVADWCLVDMVEPDGALRRLAISHADPAKVDAAWNLDRLYPPDTAVTHGPLRVMQTGRTELTPDITDAMLVAVARNEGHLSVLRGLGLVSSLCTPLTARGRPLGVLTLMTAESARRYGTADILLAEELARRAALAVDSARLYRAARQAREESEAANRAKDQFLAVLSHELRTPLTPVLATVTSMLDDPEPPTDIRQALELIRGGVELEARLIDDLLDITRVAHGKLHLDRKVVNAHELVHQTLGICRSDMYGKRIRLEVSLKADRHHVEADPARLQQVFWNLIKNAVKFTPEGGCLVIRSRDEITPDGDRLIVEVSDTGIGIDPEALPWIFNAFEQGEESVTRRFGGLGLGLAISKSVTEAHGGRLWADSPGRGLGATFTLELAVAEPPALPDPTAVPLRTAEPRRGLRILLVDDNLPTLQVMTRLLRQRQYEVTAAGTMAVALEAGLREDFDLIVTDIGLPDGTGWELMSRLRQARPIPGIAMTGYGMDEDMRRSRDAGFETHMTKPVDFVKLEAVIRGISLRELPPCRILNSDEA
jgi:PAS domain S-box-containing protein